MTVDSTNPTDAMDAYQRIDRAAGRHALDRLPVQRGRAQPATAATTPISTTRSCRCRSGSGPQSGGAGDRRQLPDQSGLRERAGRLDRQPGQRGGGGRRRNGLPGGLRRVELFRRRRGAAGLRYADGQPADQRADRDPDRRRRAQPGVRRTSDLRQRLPAGPGPDRSHHAGRRTARPCSAPARCRHRTPPTAGRWSAERQRCWPAPASSNTPSPRRARPARPTTNRSSTTHSFRPRRSAWRRRTGAYQVPAVADPTTGAAQIALTSPVLYVNWVDNAPHTITWSNFGNAGASNQSVQIDAVPGNPAWHRACRASRNCWRRSPRGPATPAPTPGSRRPRQCRTAPMACWSRSRWSAIRRVFDRSTEPFTVPENGSTYYVNDGSTANDQYTTAPGSNRNDGKLPSQPLPNIDNVLRNYSLTSGSVIYVDPGYLHDDRPVRGFRQPELRAGDRPGLHRAGADQRVRRGR